MANINKNHLGTQITFCKVCGLEFEQELKGRYKEYCSQNCKNYTKYFNALERVISSINFQDYRYVKSIKSDLFSVVNNMPKRIES